MDDKMSPEQSEQPVLDFWKMKNLSTCEYDSVARNSAWVEADFWDEHRDD